MFFLMVADILPGTFLLQYPYKALYFRAGLQQVKEQEENCNAHWKKMHTEFNW